MRWSSGLIPTLREDPAEAETISHRLLTRAGLIHKLASGVYVYLPAGWRALHQAISIVREEMNAAGAVELLMAVLQPVDLWQRTGRETALGDILLKTTDRNDAELILGPTHEEVITSIAAQHVSSYRQLPITLYQIQTKFRDEPRPRGGIIRSREFLMKDAYSFGVDEESLRQSYQAMYDAYCRIFDRCGLDYRIVEADSGAMGGSVSQEFMVPTPNGEDRIVSCPDCGYAANQDRAECGVSDGVATGEAAASLPSPEQVSTPGQRSIEEVSQSLKVDPQQMIKSLIYSADGHAVAVLVRGDHQLSESKLARFLEAAHVVPADAETIQRVTGAPVGFSGPVGLSGVPLVGDQAVLTVTDGVTGANAQDAHLRHVQPGRDFQLDQVGDLRVAERGDACPRCTGGQLEVDSAMEVGHVFMLGTKYSAALSAMFTDQDGQERPAIMGCYGIGVSRLLAASAEQRHDEAGLTWARALAPYEVALLLLNPDDSATADVADRLYHELSEHHVRVLYDDRDARPGVKFKDADLLGSPVQLVVAQRGIKDGAVELQERATHEPAMVPIEEAVSEIIQRLDTL